MAITPFPRKAKDVQSKEANAWFQQVAEGLNNVVPVATQSTVEAATANTGAITPSTIKYSPNVAKVWLQASSASAILSSVGVTSITDTGTGTATANFSVTFSSTNYAVVGSAPDEGAGNTLGISYGTRTTTSLPYSVYYTATGTYADKEACFAVFGDLA